MTTQNRFQVDLRSDRGVALPMVILVFVVVVALVSAVTVAIVGSSTVTATNKSIVQAQAAAEAGVDAAFASLSTGLCSSVAANAAEMVGPAGTQPMYELQVTFLSDTGATSNCTSATQVRVASTGYASDGVSTKRMESIRAITTTPTTSSTYGTFPAVINGSGGDIPFVIASGIDGMESDVLAISGDVACKRDVAGRIGTDKGQVDMENGCTSAGDVWATTNLYVRTQATVNGNAYLISGTAKVVEIVGTVNGNVYTSAESVDIKGVVTGSVFHVNPASTTFNVTGTVNGSVETTAAAVQLKGNIGGNVLHQRTGATSLLYESGNVAGEIWTTAKVARFTQPVNGRVVQINAGDTGSKFTLESTSTGSLWSTSQEMTILGNVGAVGAPRPVTQNSAATAVFALRNSKTIVGDVWASGSATIDTSVVRGNVTAAGTALSTITPINSLRITGNLLTGGVVREKNKDLTEQELRAAAVQGTVQMNATVTRTGITNPTPSTLQALPVQPASPGWLDYRYEASVWEQKAGYLPGSVFNLKGLNACNLKNNDAGFNSVDAAVRTQDGKITLDGSQCSDGISFEGRVFTLNSDVVIVAPAGINMTATSWSSAQPRSLRVVQSDAIMSNGKPDCPSSNKLGVDLKQITANNDVRMAVYTPCNIDMQASTIFKGHIVAGTRNFQSNAVNFAYYPVGLPGSDWDDTTSTPTTPSTGPRTLGALQSQRNLEG